MGCDVRWPRESEVPSVGPSGTSEVLMVQLRLRDPVKTLIGTSSEVNVSCFLLVTFTRLEILPVSFPHSVVFSLATAKQ